MGDRKGDTTIYIIYGFFFACIIGGGVFLCLYIIQPNDSESITWYVISGMTLVAIPWLFWFLIYLYRCFCFRPHDVQFVDEGSRSPKSSPKKTSNFNSCDAKSPPHSPMEGRERRVHFGVVVEMEDDDDGQEHHHHEDDTRKLQL
ncbi:unnamed protein product [Lupinus luteus]|uniref:Transmembrane protein n=1 Tax=Lupinus luteus TaxID=3873 RepID=A0AAV1Y8W6_LUPLU